MDQWIETGRQLVDGVAGNRPGKRKSINKEPRMGSSLENVGRWVGDKLDWLLEDEEGWLEPWQTEQKVNYTGGKRPLEAISRRTNDVVSSFNEDQSLMRKDEWPEESSFRVERWQRRQSETRVNDEDRSTGQRQKSRAESRPLPRSSRRRD